MVEFLDAIQNLIIYFFDYTSKLHFLTMNVVFHKILVVVFFDATISLPVCCNAYRNTE